MIEVSEIEKTSLDEQHIEEMDLLVYEALEFNKELLSRLFEMRRKSTNKTCFTDLFLRNV
ncbi:hypothetical protein SC09_Contig19orf01319 [Bacillus subtilis]|uniref:Uncharacterized protein n=1 Tax=Bacillus subtilis TaxID=1423 RepID=A0A0D1LA75_BACIU|nr:hypothetical protein SC09_Contig19orf01319 [Bacillus subtilis]